MRLTNRDRILRWVLFASVLASSLITSLLASPVFAGDCPSICTTG